MKEPFHTLFTAERAVVPLNPLLCAPCAGDAFILKLSDAAGSNGRVYEDVLPNATPEEEKVFLSDFLADFHKRMGMRYRDALCLGR